MRHRPIRNKENVSEERREVAFHHVVSVRPVERVEDLPEYECDSVWYSPFELDRFRKRDRRLWASIKDSPEADKDILIDVYGLETPERKEARQQRVENCRLAVLLEQDHLSEKHRDFSCIARISRRFSLQSVVAAQRRGKEMAMDIVEDVLREYKASEDQHGKYGYQDRRIRQLQKCRDRGRRMSSLGPRRNTVDRNEVPFEGSGCPRSYGRRRS